MRLTHEQYGILVSIVFMFFVMLSIVSGVWQSFVNVENIVDKDTGYLDPEIIRGSMTFDDILAATGMDYGQLLTNLGLPLTIPSNTRFNEISNYVDYEYHTENIREYFRQKNEGYKDNSIDCPYGIHDDSYPGYCSLYIDRDNDGVCDLS